MRHRLARLLRRLAQAERLAADRLDPPPTLAFTTTHGEGYTEARIIGVRRILDDYADTPEWRELRTPRGW
jgi:hypothetical protein